MSKKKSFRNSPCPCGSGKKAKHCCLQQLQDVRHAIRSGVPPQSLMVQRILSTVSERVDPQSAPSFLS